KVGVVDVRSPQRYEAGHIPGAINIPLATIKPDDDRLKDADAIVVYAAGWAEYLSPAGAKKLLAIGYENVFDFRGGLELWQAYGGRVEKTAP
ncbi:MAG: rhodanese-like domain-containing protein, partial [Phycisphaeraceae bacterium]|nr:rhodanese-like domain-containing protein [Phycisphaeraceae bacterium]